MNTRRGDVYDQPPNIADVDLDRTGRARLARPARDSEFILLIDLLEGLLQLWLMPVAMVLWVCFGIDLDDVIDDFFFDLRVFRRRG